MKLKKKEF
jgi:hypothetical protein